MDPIRIAIIGGGPGGLSTAYLLGKRATFPHAITLFEASGRLGGKILTPRFSAARIPYEAGAAELYDYSQLGPDPLRELVAELGLTTKRMGGDAVVMGDRILRTAGDIRAALGRDAAQALDSLTSRARSSITPADYYESDWKADNDDPLLGVSFAQLLDEIGDESARRYVEVAIHSDLATEPEKTSAMYGLQNYLMNSPEYMRLYTIDGGLECLPAELAKRINADLRLNQPVVAVEGTRDGSYRVTSRADDGFRSDEYDFVVVALPNNWIPFIDWRGSKLTKAMREHVARYAYPAHYLRVSVLFERPFWRGHITDSYFMLDAFGGCCVYDESLRNATERYGVLGWLLSGEAALTMSNLDDSLLVRKVIESLPAPLQARRESVLDARVHRWLGSVNGLPGGRPLREPDSRHVPEPADHPGLFVVGDYLFDSTLNGVLDSADTVVEWIREEAVDELAPASEMSSVLPEAVNLVRPTAAADSPGVAVAPPATAPVARSATGG